MYNHLLFFLELFLDLSKNFWGYFRFGYCRHSFSFYFWTAKLKKLEQVFKKTLFTHFIFYETKIAHKILHAILISISLSLIKFSSQFLKLFFCIFAFIQDTENSINNRCFQFLFINYFINSSGCIVTFCNHTHRLYGRFYGITFTNQVS